MCDFAKLFSLFFYFSSNSCLCCLFFLVFLFFCFFCDTRNCERRCHDQVRRRSGPPACCPWLTTVYFQKAYRLSWFFSPDFFAVQNKIFWGGRGKKRVAGRRIRLMSIPLYPFHDESRDLTLGMELKSGVIVPSLQEAEPLLGG